MATVRELLRKRMQRIALGLDRHQPARRLLDGEPTENSDEEEQRPQEVSGRQAITRTEGDAATTTPGDPDQQSWQDA